MIIELFFFINKYLVKKKRLFRKILLSFFSIANLINYSKILDKYNFSRNLLFNQNLSIIGEQRLKKNILWKKYSNDLFKIKIQKLIALFSCYISKKFVKDTDYLFYIFHSTVKKNFINGGNMFHRNIMLILKIIKEEKYSNHLNVKKFFYNHSLFKKVYLKISKISKTVNCIFLDFFDQKKKTFLLKYLFEKKIISKFKVFDTSEILLVIKKFIFKNKLIIFDNVLIFKFACLKITGFHMKEKIFNDLLTLNSKKHFDRFFSEILSISIKKKKNRLLIGEIFLKGFLCLLKHFRIVFKKINLNTIMLYLKIKLNKIFEILHCGKYLSVLQNNFFKTMMFFIHSRFKKKNFSKILFIESKIKNFKNSKNKINEQMIFSLFLVIFNSFQKKIMSSRSNFYIKKTSIKYSRNYNKNLIFRNSFMDIIDKKNVLKKIFHNNNNYKKENFLLYYEKNLAISKQFLIVISVDLLKIKLPLGLIHKQFFKFYDQTGNIKVELFKSRRGIFFNLDEIFYYRNKTILTILLMSMTRKTQKSWFKIDFLSHIVTNLSKNVYFNLQIKARFIKINLFYILLKPLFQNLRISDDARFYNINKKISSLKISQAKIDCKLLTNYMKIFNHEDKLLYKSIKNFIILVFYDRIKRKRKENKKLKDYISAQISGNFSRTVGNLRQIMIY